MFPATVGLLAGLALLLYLGALRWPLLQDTSLFNYIAWLIHEGKAPYVDIWDVNFPGPYLLHLFVLQLPFQVELSLRLVDFGFVVFTGLVFWHVMPTGGVLSKLGAFSTWVLLYLSWGPMMCMERDVVISSLELGAVAFFAGVLEEKIDRRLGCLCGGVCLGIAFAFKPFVVVALGLLLVAYVLSMRSQDRPFMASAALAIVGFGIPCLLTAIWLIRQGALGAFVSQFRDYVLPVYSGYGTDRTGTVQELLANTRRLFTKDSATSLLWLAGLMGAWFQLRRSPITPRVVLLFAGMLAAILQMLLQRKAFYYHFFPIWTYCIVFAWSMGASSQDRETSAEDAATGDFRNALLVIVSVFFLIFRGGPMFHNMSDLGDVGGQLHANAQRMVEALAGSLETGDTIQPLEHEEGALEALYQLRVKMPTRFVYDWPVLNLPPNPIAAEHVQLLRREFFDAMRKTPPRFIIVTEKSWLDSGYDRLTQFPEFAAWLDEKYELFVEEPTFRILIRRDPDRQ